MKCAPVFSLVALLPAVCCYVRLRQFASARSLFHLPRSAPEREPGGRRYAVGGYMPPLP